MSQHTARPNRTPRPITRDDIERLFGIGSDPLAQLFANAPAAPARPMQRVFIAAATGPAVITHRSIR